jgi:hypothetical protein
MTRSALPIRLTLAIAGLALVGRPALAASYALGPGDTAIVVRGPAEVTKGSIRQNCDVIIKGAIDKAGEGRITSADFKGGMCASIKANGLPWLIKVTGPGAGVIRGVSVKASLFGGCGPADIPVALGKAGEITLAPTSIKPDCSMQGRLTSTPAITVVRTGDAQ